ncbi:YbdD/YjiX family protein [Chondromyces apiculatus]|uniref:YbdD/YjiX family protein n=1 Tax=Chondromyces apiculatus TaxID=51 RepID=UPI0009DF29E5|nr:YbdD/YjiX family protein [Chondromyces apiculatus]
MAEGGWGVRVRARAGAVARGLRDMARLMVGVPSYETYVEHMRKAHPGEAPMTYAEFFRERQEARYGGRGRGGFRCC